MLFIHHQSSKSSRNDESDVSSSRRRRKEDNSGLTSHEKLTLTCMHPRNPSPISPEFASHQTRTRTDQTSWEERVNDMMLQARCEQHCKRRGVAKAGPSQPGRGKQVGSLAGSLAPGGSVQAQAKSSSHLLAGHVRSAACCVSKPAASQSALLPPAPARQACSGRGRRL